MAEQMARDDYLQLLNRYFEMVLEPVNKQGGEVLKFIGDAVLAIFPICDDQSDTLAQANKALAAAQMATSGIEINETTSSNGGMNGVDLGISLHIGDVTYGNVGGADRLDFTVIGPAVNLASRLENMCKTSGNRIVMSQDFKDAIFAGNDNPPRIASIGSHQLDGIATAQQIFAQQ